MVEPYQEGDVVWVVHRSTGSDSDYRWIIDGPLLVHTMKKEEDGYSYTFVEWQKNNAWVREEFIFNSMSEAVTFRAKQFREGGRDAHPVLSAIRQEHLRGLQRI